MSRRSACSRRPGVALAATVCLALHLLGSSHVRAQSTDDTRTRAAAAFDEGVRRFERAEYAAAAKFFLQANGLAPNNRAVLNAIAAARKAKDHVLLVTAAQRALEQGRADPELATQGREAIAEASGYLARVELSCQPTPCGVLLNNEAVDPGWRFVLPGNHLVAATAADDAKAEQRLKLEAGTTYQVVLHPVRGDAQPRPADVTSKVLAPPAAAEPARDEAPPSDHNQGLHPAFFYVGLGVSALAAGAMTWSGIDTLQAKNELPASPSKAQVSDVRDRIQRTNLLLSGTVVVAGLTAGAGLWWVDWGDDTGAAAAIVPLHGGAAVLATGRF